MNPRLESWISAKVFTFLCCFATLVFKRLCCFHECWFHLKLWQFYLFHDFFEDRMSEFMKANQCQNPGILCSRAPFFQIIFVFWALSKTPAFPIPPNIRFAFFAVLLESITTFSWITAPSLGLINISAELAFMKHPSLSASISCMKVSQLQRGVLSVTKAKDTGSAWERRKGHSPA